MRQSLLPGRFVLGALTGPTRASAKRVGMKHLGEGKLSARHEPALRELPGARPFGFAAP